MAETNLFYSLIHPNNLNLLKLFYKQHRTKIDINAVHGDGNTALHKAIGLGCDTLIRFIMRLGPNIEVRSDKSWTALYKAVYLDNEEAVNILLAHNANVNCRTEDLGKTPLHLAVFNRSQKIARNLLNRNADPNVLINSGSFQFYSALHIAVINRDRNMVDLLLWYGVNTELKCYQGYTALWLAMLNSDLEIVECLCEYGADCNAKPNAGPYMNSTPLFAAVELNRLDMVKLLINNSANVDARDDQGRTPLFHAVYLGHEEMAQLLLNNNATVNVFAHSGDYRGTSPLLIAVNNKNCDMVKLLLKKKANVNAKQSNGYTPLHYAVQSACFVIAKLLIKHRAKVNVVRGWQELTPLHDAVQLGDNLMVQLLLRYGARVNMRNAKGQTPIYLAAQLGYWRIIDKLLKYGADPNISDNKHNSPLHIAIKSKQFKTVILLVQGGAKINAFNNRCQTPLYFALRSENDNIINILLNRGAELTTKCIPKYNDGYFEYITDERTLQYLIERGVDVNHQSTEGETALHRLIQMSIPEVVAYMTSFMNPKTSESSILIFDKDSICDELVYKVISGSGIEALGCHNFNAIHMAIHKRAVNLFQCSRLYGASTSTAFNIATNTDMMKGMFRTLLNSGADIELANNQGLTPLHLATKYKRHTYMHMLLENGATADLEDKYGSTPLMIAMHNADHSAVTILLSHGSNGTSLNNIAWKFCDSQFNLAKVLLQFNYAKKKYIEDLAWPENPFDRSLENVVNACKSEIEDMGTSYVGNSRLQFLHLVNKPIHKLVPFIRNKEIKQILNSSDYEVDFPIFADDIKLKVRLMDFKNIELIKCKAALNTIFDDTIPCMVVDMIIEYLDDDDHKSLSQFHDLYVNKIM